MTHRLLYSCILLPVIDRKLYIFSQHTFNLLSLNPGLLHAIVSSPTESWSFPFGACLSSPLAPFAFFFLIGKTRLQSPAPGVRVWPALFSHVKVFNSICA